MFSRKSWEGKLKFFPTILLCANNQALGKTLWHTSKFGFVVCSFQAHGKNTGLPCAKLSPCVSSAGSRQTASYAVCNFFAVRFAEWHTAKISFAVCLSFVVCCFGLHTANSAFDVCPRLSPRQNSGHTNSGHTANTQFPVVYEHV